MREDLYLNSTENTGIEGYFEKNPELYEQISRDYVEYIMDLSVNELTVHWCGHSQHDVQEPYLELEDAFLEYNEKYYSYLKGLVFCKQIKTEEKTAFKSLLEAELGFLNRGFVKPMTLKKIAEYSNQLV